MKTALLVAFAAILTVSAAHAADNTNGYSRSSPNTMVAAPADTGSEAYPTPRPEYNFAPTTAGVIQPTSHSAGIQTRNSLPR